MDENAVIEATCNYLRSEGCKILKRCTTSQKGIDIIAENAETKTKFFVEAKGSTSSKEGTNRFGKPYTASQVFSHASKGVLACLRLRAEYSDCETSRVMLAVPDLSLYKRYLEPKVLKDLEKIGIKVLFF